MDLRLANQAAFSQMVEAVLCRPVEGTRLPFASLRHLLALKLVVLRERQSHRCLKDLDDVVMLIQQNHLDVRSAEFRELVEKYGDAEGYEKILHACG